MAESRRNEISFLGMNETNKSNLRIIGIHSISNNAWQESYSKHLESRKESTSNSRSSSNEQVPPSRPQNARKSMTFRYGRKDVTEVPKNTERTSRKDVTEVPKNTERTSRKDVEEVPKDTELGRRKTKKEINAVATLSVLDAEKVPYVKKIKVEPKESNGTTIQVLDVNKEYLENYYDKIIERISELKKQDRTEDLQISVKKLRDIGRILGIESQEKNSLNNGYAKQVRSSRKGRK